MYSYGYFLFLWRNSQKNENDIPFSKRMYLMERKARVDLGALCWEVALEDGD